MILIVDNYDSFVHNLARYFNRLGFETLVVRNTEATVEFVDKTRPQVLVFSPGPCRPKDSGYCLELVRQFQDRLPMLGICLGHQIIAEALGARVIRSNRPVHGRTSLIWHVKAGIFEGIPNPFAACRYHSLVVDQCSLPRCLVPTAWSGDGTVMAFEHRRLPIVGFQFHPESILTEFGYELLARFLKKAGIQVSDSVPTVNDELCSDAAMLL